MIRTDIIQKIIDKKRATRYLEIGVNNGDNFFPIVASQKIAVDPGFAFSKELELEWNTKNSANLTAQYVKSTSDDFFANTHPIDPFDVVFIDGLHTYEQSLRDVINSLDNLKENGVIVIHDCKPPHVAAACPATSLQEADEIHLPGWTGEWCGDVWKTICYLRIHRQDLQVFVLDCDYGVGIVRKGKPDTDLNLSEDALTAMTYEDAIDGNYNCLNLKNENYLFEFLEKI